MATPQIENGHVDIANELVEAFSKIRISGEEMQCLWVIFRKTYGWKKKEDWIALSQFQSMTGISKPSIIRALNKLFTKNIIYKKVNGFGVSYGIIKNYHAWKPLTKKLIVYKKVNQRLQKSKSALTKMSPTKETITKETITKEIHSRFSEIWKKYPSKDGIKQAEKHFKTTVRTEEDWNNINKALKNYLEHLKVNDWKRPKNGSTWFNNWKDWIDWKEPEPPKNNKVKYDEQSF